MDLRIFADRVFNSGVIDMNEYMLGALELASRYAQIDGAHHKMWVIDQMVRVLLKTEEAYQQWVLEYEGEDYHWDTGIAP